MKKFFLMAVVCISAIAASAQVEQGFRSGFRATVGMSNVAGEGDDATLGYGIAWIAEYDFSPNVFLQSGVGIENIAHKEDAVDGTIDALYAQLPIHIGGRFELGDVSSLFIQAGPYIGYGIAGSKIEWDNGETNYFDIAERFDYGVGGRIGIEVSNLQISAGANYGIAKASDVGDGYHNLSINLGLAYFF